MSEFFFHFIFVFFYMFKQFQFIVYRLSQRVFVFSRAKNIRSGFCFSLDESWKLEILSQVSFSAEQVSIQSLSPLLALGKGFPFFKGCL